MTNQRPETMLVVAVAAVAAVEVSVCKTIAGLEVECPTPSAVIP